MAIGIVDFPMKNGGSFQQNVKLPEGSGPISSCLICLGRTSIPQVLFRRRNPMRAAVHDHLFPFMSKLSRVMCIAQLSHQPHPKYHVLFMDRKVPFLAVFLVDLETFHL